MRFHELPDETPETFFDAMFNREDDVVVSGTSAVGIFDLKHKLTHFLTDTSSAGTLNGATDLFYSATLQNPETVKRVAFARKQKKPRWYAESTSVIGALWLDADVANGTHKKDGLFPSDEAALDFLYNRLPIKPSFVVKTGGGFHAYWILGKVIEVGDDMPVSRAQAIVQAWQDFCREDAKLRGYTLDATHDLARMLRPPGTLNGKYDPGTNIVVVVTPDDVPSLDCADTYDYEVFTLLCGARIEEIETCSAHAPMGAVEVGPVDGLDVSCTATKTAPKIVTTLCDMSVDFAAIWGRKCAHLPSQSEYDLSIATWLGKYDATDQVIVDALVVHRRDAGLDAKDRVDYYARTLVKAKTGKEEKPENLEDAQAWREQHAANRIAEDAASETALREQREAGGVPRPVCDRIADVNELIGGQVNLVRVLKYIGDPPTYVLETDCGTITLGRVDRITSPAMMRNSIAESTGKLIRRYKAKGWDPIAQAILNACEDVDLGEASRPSQAIGQALESYLDETRAGADRDDALSTSLPWSEHATGELWFSLAHFLKWLYAGGQKLTRTEGARRLRELGSEPKTIKFIRQRGANAGKRTSTSYWRVPHRVEPEGEGDRAAEWVEVEDARG